MGKRIWLEKTIKAVKTEEVKTPWARGTNGKALKAAVRDRVEAA
ncbi:MAG: hypothetical protein P8X50_05720 [Maritimibacter sp.]|jgi:hypothetical protein